MNTEPLPPGPDDDEANAATLPPSLAPRAAIDALMAQPERYGFFQAARLLFRTHGLTDLRAGGREAVRFGVIDSLSFPPVEIPALQPAPEQGDAERRMTVAFPGQTGPSGVLPHPYTRWLSARTRPRAPGPPDFLALFNHPLSHPFRPSCRQHL